MTMIVRIKTLRGPCHAACGDAGKLSSTFYSLIPVSTRWLSLSTVAFLSFVDARQTRGQIVYADRL